MLKYLSSMYNPGFYPQDWKRYVCLHGEGRRRRKGKGEEERRTEEEVEQELFHAFKEISTVRCLFLYSFPFQKSTLFLVSNKALA